MKIKLNQFYFTPGCAALYPALSVFPSENLQLHVNTQPPARQSSSSCLRLHIRASISRNNRARRHYSDASSRPLVGSYCALCVCCQSCAQNFPDNRVTREWLLLQYLDHVTVQVNSERIPYCHEIRFPLDHPKTAHK